MPDPPGRFRAAARSAVPQELVGVLGHPLPLGAFELLRLDVREPARFLGSDREVVGSAGHRAAGQAPARHAGPPPGSPRLRRSFPVFIEFSPVYAEPQVPATPQGRAKALTGWAMGIFAADEILDPALANAKGVSVALAYASPGAKPTVLARAGQPQRGSPARPSPSPPTRVGSSTWRWIIGPAALLQPPRGWRCCWAPCCSRSC